VDAAVHSLKDVPTRLPDGITLGAILEREDPRDVFLPAPGRPGTLDGLPPGARVGTSSLRRRAQLLHRRPDLIVEDLRGNLDTRFARLREGRLDAAILARAGVHRLGLLDHVGEVLAAPDWLPAVGQGALGVAIREDDFTVRDLVAPLTDPDALAATTAERAFLRELEGGCQVPIGALATREGERLTLHAFVASLDGTKLLRGEASGRVDDPAGLGSRLAAELVERGAAAILGAIRGATTDALPEASAP
jgi:hydroxymethylbilane synthase